MGRALIAGCWGLRLMEGSGAVALARDARAGVVPDSAPQFLLRTEGNDMDHFIGVDVSLASSALCVVDMRGRVVKEVKVASVRAPR